MRTTLDDPGRAGPINAINVRKSQNIVHSEKNQKTLKNQQIPQISTSPKNKKSQINKIITNRNIQNTRISSTSEINLYIPKFTTTSKTNFPPHTKHNLSKLSFLLIYPPHSYPHMRGVTYFKDVTVKGGVLSRCERETLLALVVRGRSDNVYRCLPRGGGERGTLATL